MGTLRSIIARPNMKDVHLDGHLLQIDFVLSGEWMICLHSPLGVARSVTAVNDSPGVPAAFFKVTSRIDRVTLLNSASSSRERLCR